MCIVGQSGAVHVQIIYSFVNLFVHYRNGRSKARGGGGVPGSVAVILPSLTVGGVVWCHYSIVINCLHCLIVVLSLSNKLCRNLFVMVNLLSWEYLCMGGL